MTAQEVPHDALLGVYSHAKSLLRGLLQRDPMDSMVVVVLGGSYLFYLAERDENPKVRDFFDALVFVSTCLSVGYADVFARTKEGKAIAAALMSFGPALSARLLDPPQPC